MTPVFFLLLSVILVFSFALVLVGANFLLSIFIGAPYTGSETKRVQQMINLASVASGQKLKRELKPSAKVISNHFRFPNLKPVKKEGVIYVYKI